MDLQTFRVPVTRPSALSAWGDIDLPAAQVRAALGFDAVVEADLIEGRAALPGAGGNRARIVTGIERPTSGSDMGLVGRN